MDELRECPFCGGVKIEVDYLACDVWQVTCYDCVATGPRGSKKDAIDGWNRRHEQI